MKFLFDSNLFIPAEPTAPSDVEAKSPVVIELLRTLGQGQHQVYVHPESHRELTEEDRDPGRRDLRRLLLQKYIQLPSPPRAKATLRASIGEAAPGTNDAVDNALLAAVHGDAVDYLVTEDTRLLRKARAAQLARRVLSAGDALATVRSLFPIVPPPPPAVEQVRAYELDEHDSIFDSFRADYPNFDRWLSHSKRDHRLTWLIRKQDGALAGLTIVKSENDRPYELPGKVLKICSFKVSETARGYRFGELLLKSVFGYAFENSHSAAYVTVFEKYTELIELFTDFGFTEIPHRSSLSEVVLAKPLRFTREDYEKTAPLDFNIRFGPPHVKTDGIAPYMVPIRPEYHKVLFPEAEQQLDIISGRNPFGNAIRKAYLCHANVRTIRPGDVLLFYRSVDLQALRCVGVAEDTLVSKHPQEIARFVGQRTVYGYNEIVQMCGKAEVLAILFRHARTLDSPQALSVLKGSGVLKSAPQSIARMRPEGMRWLQDHLGPWP